MSKLDKATPLPWFLHDFSSAAELFGYEQSPGQVTISCDHPATLSVAVMAKAITGEIEEARANALLIVRAVNNFGALIEILRDLLDAAGNPSPELLKRAAAVLSAAEGGDNV